MPTLMETIKTMYRPEEVKEETKTEIVEQDDKVEKEEMALSQLYFVKYAAEEIIEYIEEYDGEIEEWYQNKLSKVHSDMESLHSHIEGEKRRLGLDDDDEEEEDEDEMDEELQIEEAAHKVSVTVSDPGHPMASKRDEKMERRVIVNADNKDHAVVKAKEFYKKKGLKVHDANYHSPQGKSTMKTEDLDIENEMINEDLMKLDPITNTLMGLAVAAGVAMYAFDFWFGKDDYEKTRKPIERGMEKAKKAGNAKLYHSLAAKYYEDQVTKYTKALNKLRTDPNTFYKKDSLKTGAKKGEMKKFEKRAEEELLRVLEIAKKKQKEFEAKEKSGEPISKAYYESTQQKQETLSIEETIKRVVMGEKLHPNQKKLDVDGDGDIEGDDLADLRAGKHKKKSGGKEQIDVKPKLDEEEMSDADMKKREEIVKSLKKRTQDFKDRYGDRWKEVMYATATKMAMKD